MPRKNRGKPQPIQTLSDQLRGLIEVAMTGEIAVVRARMSAAMEMVAIIDQILRVREQQAARAAAAVVTPATTTSAGPVALQSTKPPKPPATARPMSSKSPKPASEATPLGTSTAKRGRGRPKKTTPAKPPNGAENVPAAVATEADVPLPMGKPVENLPPSQPMPPVGDEPMGEAIE